MEISDGMFRAGVVAGGIALVLGIVGARFCGSVEVPAKPPPVTTAAARGHGGQLLAHASATAQVYLEHVRQDAEAAGVRAPTLDDMKRKLVYRMDGARHVLEVGEPALELAGLRLAAVQAGGAIALEIHNATGADVAYLVVTKPLPARPCTSVRARPFNAMVIAKGEHETRVECDYTKQSSIAITRVETMELPPLSAWYVAQVPPTSVGVDARVARGHRAPETTQRCSPVLAHSLKEAVTAISSGEAPKSGEIGWRDLVDFYARHRCQTYQFPLSYRAIAEDGAGEIPAVASGM